MCSFRGSLAMVASGVVVAAITNKVVHSTNISDYQPEFKIGTMYLYLRTCTYFTGTENRGPYFGPSLSLCVYTL